MLNNHYSTVDGQNLASSNRRPVGTRKVSNPLKTRAAPPRPPTSMLAPSRGGVSNLQGFVHSEGGFGACILRPILNSGVKRGIYIQACVRCILLKTLARFCPSTVAVRTVKGWCVLAPRWIGIETRFVARHDVNYLGGGGSGLSPPLEFPTDPMAPMQTFPQNDVADSRAR